MIEKKKWDYLADIRARTGAKTLYINSTPHGVYQFDLGAITEPEWALKRLPITTDFGNKATNERLAGFLDIRLAALLLAIIPIRILKLHFKRLLTGAYGVILPETLKGI